jgi:LmbE family N-acetylglucosaminyl deacetylase
VKRFAPAADFSKVNHSRADFLQADFSKRNFLAAKLLACLLLLFFFSAAPRSAAQFPPASGSGPGLPETIEAIDSARVTTRILYITAHPDDESAAVLTYLARGLHAEVALLTLTRGEGGQNALGPEQAPQLGLIRTQELLAATRGYGVKLYFTRAKDFGYSKTPEETEKIWGDAVLGDMVRVIREFRPNIVINGWGGVHSGHGHHQLSGIWTPKAVKLAADSDVFPSEIPAWDALGKGVQILDVERGMENPHGYILPVDNVSPLYGKSWRQIGLDAFVNHRTQGIAGFINSPFLRRPLALIPEDGSKLDPSSLTLGLSAGASLLKPSGYEKEMIQIDTSLKAAREAALKLDWESTVRFLIIAERALKSATESSFPNLIHKQPHGYEVLDFLGRVAKRVDVALNLAAGVEFTADADRADVVRGEVFSITLLSHCRPEVACRFGEQQFFSRHRFERKEKNLDQSKNNTWSLAVGELNTDKVSTVRLPPLSEYPPPEPELSPEASSLLTASQEIQISDFSFYSTSPVSHVETTSTSVTRVPIRLVPAYTLAVEPSQVVEVLGQSRKPFDVLLRVHSYSTKSATVSIGLDLPDGLQSSVPVEVHFDGIGDQYAKLTVMPPAKLEHGNYTITAYAKRGDEKSSTSLEPLSTMPIILWSEPAQTVVHAFDINIPANLRVGYISAEGEMIPDALKRVGINVEMLDASALTFGDLSRFHTIIVGVRAYELRPELPSANQRLLDFVSAGGTLVVQYNRDGIWDKLLPAPYSAIIGSPTPRTTDENAAVTFLQPDDPLLNTPNQITAADFQNWVQERGLYYWSQFDSRYTPLLSMHDPGEKDLKGALVYVHYGKGTYIYTGLAFFRELPEGVPGAYRLFVNILAAGWPSGNRTQ